MIKNFLVILFFLLLFPLYSFAAPNLQVSVSSGPVLLGGKAKYTINITNTGPDKGYALSVKNTFSSSPKGREVAFSSAKDGLVPSAESNPFEFVDIKDLAPNETYTFEMTVDMSGDTNWKAYDDIINNVVVSVMENPDGSGTEYSASATDTNSVQPISLVDKRTLQTTAVEQATGVDKRPFFYEIEVQNNYVQNSDNVLVVDTLPDGIEYLGEENGHACSSARADDSGITSVTCSLGTMTAGQKEIIKLKVGIRYDYYGTDNGGTNRAYNDFDGTPALGTAIPDKSVFTNSASLSADFNGSAVATQTKTSDVTAAYATVSKSSSIESGGNGSRVDYTITYSLSEYYNILNENSSGNNSSLTLHDKLPDGLTYLSGSASIPYSSFTKNPDGTTDIYWHSQALSSLTASTGGVYKNSEDYQITFSAIMDDAWEGSGGAPGEKIVSGDSIINVVTSYGIWDDQIDTARQNESTSSSASARILTVDPPITKEVFDPTTGNWLPGPLKKTVGDIAKFRVRFNTTDGQTPIISNINFGDIVLTDWLPKGMSYVSGSASETYSNLSDFVNGDPNSNSPLTMGSFKGIRWNLGDMKQGAWWQAIFNAKVDDSPEVQDEKIVTNIWKMSGKNTAGKAYSKRSQAQVKYVLPYLELSKSSVSQNSPMQNSDYIDYTVNIKNSGGAEARQIVFSDTLLNFFDGNAPTNISITKGGSALVEGVDYLPPSWNSQNGVLKILFATSTPNEVKLAPNGLETLSIKYRAFTDPSAGSGAEIQNLASVSYNTQADGSGRQVNASSDTNDPNTDSSVETLAQPLVSKSVSPATLKIGDIATYSIEIRVPKNQILYWPSIVDSFDMEGMEYVPNSAVLNDISGSPTTAASLTNTEPTVVANSGAGDTLRWDFNNPIDNRGQANDYIFKITYQAKYTGVKNDGSTLEFVQPTGTETLNNSVDFLWNTTTSTSRTSNKSVNSTASVQIKQPLLKTTKSVTSSGPYRNGSIVSYSLVVENTGDATAYDIGLQDDISDKSSNFTITSVTHSTSGTLSEGADFSLSGSDPVSLDFAENVSLAPGEKITVNYSVKIISDLTPGEALTNTADVDWSSQSGVFTGERLYDDSVNPNYLDDQDSQTIFAAMPVFTKTLLSPSDGKASIGDILTYKLRVEVPAETLMYNPQIVDTISTDGLEYVPNSAEINDISGNPETKATLSSVIFDGGGANTGKITFSTASLIDNADLATSVGDSDYIFEITYSVRVTGKDDFGAEIFTQANSPSDNTASFTWQDSSSSGKSYSLSDRASVNINSPLPTIEKSNSGYLAGLNDVVNYTVNLKNDKGLSPIYNIVWQDTLPSVLYSNGVTKLLSLKKNGSDIPSDKYSADFSQNPLQIVFSHTYPLNAGDDIEIKYETKVSNTASLNQEYTNITAFSGKSQSDPSNSYARGFSGQADSKIKVVGTSIGDRVWFDQNGNGIQDSDEPGVSGMEVSLLDSNGNPVDNPLNPGTPYVVTTDVNGNYTFTNLSAGVYKVNFTLPAGYSFSSKSSGADNSVDSDVDQNGVSENISVAYNQILSDIDAGIMPISIGDKVWNDMNGNGIQDSGEPGVSGMEVSLLDSNGNPVDNPLNPGTPYVVTTDVNGKYLFENLPAGDYRLKFRDPSLRYRLTFKNNQGTDDSLDSDPDPISGTTATYSLGQSFAGKVFDFIDAGVFKPAKIQGRVWNDSNKDGIQDFNEKNNIAGITVKLFKDGQPVINPVTQQEYVVKTSQDGLYLFENLLPGTYSVEFETDGYNISPQTASVDDTKDSDADPQNKRIENIVLQAGESSLAQDLGLSPVYHSSRRHRRYCQDPNALNYRSYGRKDNSLCVYPEKGEKKKEDDDKKLNVEKETEKKAQEEIKSQENKKEKTSVDKKQNTSNKEKQSATAFIEKIKTFVKEKEHKTDLCKRAVKSDISFGSDKNKVEDIKILQEYLNSFEGESLSVNGVYNKETYEAVKKYQNKYSDSILKPWRIAKATGFVGDTTRGHINSQIRQSCIPKAENCPYFKEYLGVGDKGPEVLKVQKFLSELGLYGGELNGIFDNKTKEAVKKFQNENSKDILLPWGIPCKCGTGRWYQSTVTYANKVIGCSDVKMPKLVSNSYSVRKCILEKFPNWKFNDR